MCGRFTLLTDDEYMDILDIIKEVEQNTQQPVKTNGPINRTDLSPVLYSKDGHQVADLMKFGYPKTFDKGVVVNAVSERVYEKKKFMEFDRDIVERRCVVPASGYYEKKYLFRHDNTENHGVYMAGLYHIFDNQLCFVILTTKPNQSVEDIHDRMPVVLRQEDINPWLHDGQAYMSILMKVPPLLRRTVTAEAGQTTLY